MVQFKAIHELVGGVPFIGGRNAKFLYELIVEHRLGEVLELGVAHGTATCYIAAALDELGGGKVTAVDLIEAAGRYEPSPEQQLESTGLARYAEIVRMQSGYTWFLHDVIRRQTHNGRCEPVYDLAIIDGPKNWTIDGAAFFMVDKLLKPGGWLILDDLRWTYAEADTRREATDGITHRSLSEQERTVPHVQEIFELLVQQHPDYTDFGVHNEDWAVARKKPHTGWRLRR